MNEDERKRMENIVLLYYILSPLLYVLYIYHSFSPNKSWVR